MPTPITSGAITTPRAKYAPMFSMAFSTPLWTCAATHTPEMALGMTPARPVTNSASESGHSPTPSRPQAADPSVRTTAHVTIIVLMGTLASAKLRSRTPATRPKKKPNDSTPAFARGMLQVAEDGVEQGAQRDERGPHEHLTRVEDGRGTRALGI